MNQSKERRAFSSCWSESLSIDQGKGGSRANLKQCARPLNLMSRVFISYRKTDQLLAEALAKELHDVGHKVWFDEWEIGAGDSIVSKINEGLDDASYLIMCYSDAGVNSPWMSREWMAILAKQLDERNVKIIPVRLSGGDAPTILRDIKYVDLVKDWAKGVIQVLRALDGQ